MIAFISFWRSLSQPRLRERVGLSNALLVAVSVCAHYLGRRDRQRRHEPIAWSLS